MADSDAKSSLSADDDDEILNDLTSCFAKLDKQESLRQKFLDQFLSLCNPNDLMYLNSRLDERKCDLLSVLPIEIVEIILSKLDWRDLLSCCQVNKSWNEKISNNFNRLWHKQCLTRLPLDQNEHVYDQELNVNYKRVFVDLMRRSTRLESGRAFSKWQITPVEINAIAAYKNIIATATHIVRFWRLVVVETRENNGSKGWESFKCFQLQSRASSMKFDDNYLAVNTYFLSLDLYSLKTDQLLISYMGHTCAISCFDFNSHLKLLVTGSADNTIKFWSMDVDKEIKTVWSSAMNQSAQYLIASESNTIWPMRVSIQPFSSANSFLVIALCTNGFIYVTDVEKHYDDIRDENNADGDADDDLNCFTFNFKLKISTKIRDFLDAQSMDDDLLELSNLYKQGGDWTANLDEDQEDDDDEYDAEDFRLRDREEDRSQEMNMGYLMSNKSFIEYNSGTLTAFIVTDNNNYQSTKLFIKRWSLKLFKRFKNSSKLKLVKRQRKRRRSDNGDETASFKWNIDDDLDDPTFQAYTFRFKKMPFNNRLFDYLNRRTIDLSEKTNAQFEIISFGLNYCMFVDEKNNLYLTNLKSQQVKCLNLELDLDNETEKMFRLITSNTQEQFIYGSRCWFNGFKLNTTLANEPDITSLVFAFYTQQRQEVIVITWNDYEF